MQALARILLLTLLGGLLAGCVAEPVGSATPSPPFRSEAEAFAAAEATYRAYVDALNQVDLADPATFEAVYEWTTGEAEAGAREYLSQLHAEGIAILGQTKVVGVWPLSYSSSTAVAAACADVSGVDLVNSLGSSVVDADRPDQQSFEIHFVSTPDSALFGYSIELFRGGEAERCTL